MSLRVRDIRARVGRTVILHGIDLTARAGQVTAVVGPNGSGKSTLLKAMTNEVDFTGHIEINGTDAARMTPWQLAAIRGVLPQSTTLAFPFTVIEVVRMGLRVGLSAARADIPERALHAVGLGGYDNRFYQALSGGEQQRAQLARVLCQVWEPQVKGVPRWLLLDEPVASLDIGHQLLVMRLLQDYARRGGGVIAVMHDLNLSAMFADRMALVVAGVLSASGTPQAVMQNDILSRAYGCALHVNAAPRSGESFILPHMAGAAG